MIDSVRRFVKHYLLVTLAPLVVAAVALWLTVSGATYAGSTAAPLAAYTCTPTAVATFNGASGARIHVRCSVAAPGGIIYFAVCTSPDAANAARFLSVFTTAKATVKNLVIYY